MLVAGINKSGTTLGKAVCVCFLDLVEHRKPFSFYLQKSIKSDFLKLRALLKLHVYI